MKKLFYSIVIIGSITVGLTSCGGAKKEEAKEEQTEEAMEDETAEPEKASADDLIKQGQALVDASDCKTCHHPTNKIVGSRLVASAGNIDVLYTQLLLKLLVLVTGIGGHL